MITRFKRGNLAESLVVSYFVRLGFALIERNTYTPYGEIDIIMLKSSIYYFIEVKSSFTQFEVNPWIRLHSEKVHHFYDSSLYWLGNHSMDGDNGQCLYVFVHIKQHFISISQYDTF